jgi:pimeloyl-ACP methyl ester carboxylesterase
MKAVVFIPGILGTEMLSSSGEKLWPPKPLEAQFGYGRVDKLLGDDVRHGDIIEKVLCFDVYAPILEQFAELGFQKTGTDKRLYPFPYDWRCDLEHTAGLLASRLDSVDADGATDIFLVAHSMGGLVTRLVLEPDTYRARPWFEKIRSFIALAVPHQGAPLALARVLGLDSTLGISKKDFRKLSNDVRYPSGYQLLPAPNESACWNKADLAVGAVNIYDAAIAQRLGLNTSLVERARFVHDSLDHGSAPAHVRYFFFAGTGHETVTRVNVLERGGAYPTEEMVLTRTEDAGDGTVPFWSALPGAVQKQIVVNEHSGVFRGMPFKRVFYRLLGGDLGVPLEGLGLCDEAEPPRLSMPTPVIHANRPFELLLVPASPIPKIAGTLLLQRLKEDGTPAPNAAEPVSTIVYEGPRVSRLRLELPPVATAGFYELRFEGTPAASQPVRFAVATIPN